MPQGSRSQDKSAKRQNGHPHDDQDGEKGNDGSKRTVKGALAQWIPSVCRGKMMEGLQEKNEETPEDKRVHGTGQWPLVDNRGLEADLTQKADKPFSDSLQVKSASCSSNQLHTSPDWSQEKIERNDNQDCEYDLFHSAQKSIARCNSVRTPTPEATFFGRMLELLGSMAVPAISR
jgi:hypothetical protein